MVSAIDLLSEEGEPNVFQGWGKENLGKSHLVLLSCRFSGKQNNLIPKGFAAVFSEHTKSPKNKFFIIYHLIIEWSGLAKIIEKNATKIHM